MRKHEKAVSLFALAAAASAVIWAPAPTLAAEQAAAGPVATGVAAAAEAAEAGPRRSDAVIVTGTRAVGRTVAESAVPVDVISAEAIADVSFTDTQDVLKTLVPSFFTFRQPISDGATFIRPATLRGLPPDKTLVLVNGKRRHRASLVSTAGSGQQGPDVATIPASALKTVEVLRDGAGAQYGSDAIAGVLNFILKDSREGGELQVQVGGYGEGDGEDVLVSGNIGLPLLESGFINISLEYATSQGTNRGAEFSRQQSPQFDVGTQRGSQFDVALFKATYPELAGRFGNGQKFDMGNVQLWGQPENTAIRGFINAGYDFSDTLSAYAFGNYSNSEGSGDFNYRFPDPEFGRVNPNPNGRQAAIGPPIRLPDGRIWTGTLLFPVGYTPRFSGQVTDYSFVGGLRGAITDALNFDLSARYGYNKISYTMTETWNPSLGPNSPTAFKPGDLIADEWAVNADFAYTRDVAAFAGPLTIAFGAEYRVEGYEITLGDRASWQVGPYAGADPWGFCNLTQPAATRTATARGLAAGVTDINCRNVTGLPGLGVDSRDPVYNTLSVGSDGFPGYGPAVTGSSDRDSYAFYIDAEADVTERLFIALAARYENFSDFGEASDFKVAGRFEINDFLAIRGSAGTGFRAPTVGQQFTTNVSTVFINALPVNTGLFPASNPVSRFLGAKPLGPEESVSYTVGFTSSFFDIDLTVDLYRIEIEDQFWTTPTITIAAGSALQQQLIAAGVPGADSIGGVRFFQNAFDSTTEGLDIVATRRFDLGDLGVTSVTAAFNYNVFKVGTIKAGSPTNLLFQETDIFDLENNAPNWRGNVTANHSIGNWGGLLRANFVGAYDHSACQPAPARTIFTCPVTAASPTGLLRQAFAAEVQFDAEVSYDFEFGLAVAFGIRNLLDSYPEEGNPLLGETTNGRIYRSDSPVDWQGRFFYLRAKQTF
jgi:iron complex outermembrane receptor protein